MREYYGQVLQSAQWIKKSKLDKIYRVQSKCIRIITKRETLCSSYSTTTCYLWTMYRLNRRGMYIDSIVTRENLRSENRIQFKCPFTKIVKIRKSSFYRGVDIWNSLKYNTIGLKTRKDLSLYYETPLIVIDTGFLTYTSGIIVNLYKIVTYYSLPSRSFFCTYVIDPWKNTVLVKRFLK